MKKLLVSLGAIIGAIGMATAVTATIIACTPPGGETNIKKQLSEDLKKTKLGELSDKNLETIKARLKELNTNIVESEVVIELHLTKGEFSATIKVKEGSTIYEPGEVVVTFSVKQLVWIKTIQNELDKIAKSQKPFANNDAVIQALKAAKIEGVTIVGAVVKEGSVWAPIAADVNFTVTVAAEEGYKLENGQDKFDVVANVTQEVKTVSTATIQDELDQIAKSQKPFANNDAVIQALKAAKIEGVTIVGAVVKEGSVWAPIVADVNFTVTVAAKEGYKLENNQDEFDVVANVTQEVKTVSNATIQDELDKIAKSQKPFANNGVVIQTLKAAKIEGVTIVDAVVKEGKVRAWIAADVNFTVTVAAKEGYKLENDQDKFDVIASVTQEGKIVSSVTIQEALDKSAASKTYSDNSAAIATIGFTKIEGIEQINIIPKESSQDNKKNVMSSKDGTITVDQIHFEAKVIAKDGYILENKDIFEVTGNVISKNTQVELNETIYIDTNNKILKTDQQDFSNIKVNEIVKFGIFGDSTISKFSGSIVPDKLPEQIKKLRFFASKNQNKIISGIENWDTSKVTDMAAMFYQAYNFNQNIDGWDTSNVTDMSWTFFWAKAFNQNISSWNTQNVKTMSSMFEQATSFDQDISKWVVANVKSYDNFSYNANSNWTNNEKPIFK